VKTSRPLMVSRLSAICLLLLFTVSYQSHSTYSASNSYTDPDHSYFTTSLKYEGSENFFINKTNAVIQHLNFTYFFTSPEHLVVRITDNEKGRWEVPNQAPFPHMDYSKKFAPYDDALVKVEVTEKPFSFKLTRKSTNEVIFDSSVGDFIYSDYYLQISTSLATPNIYGLGERAAKLNLGPDGNYSIFNKGTAGLLENGTSGNQVYGYHPVYLLREQSNSFSMALLRSSVPMDLQIEGGKKMTYKVIGGVLDFQFFLGAAESSDPETVVKQYHKYLGGWTLQPFWSFGFHQCRWGYHNVSEMDWVLGNYSANALPLDVMWSDIDYMDKYIDFTVDEENFTSSAMSDMMTKHKKRWVPIIDAGIAINNTIWKMGADNNVYLHDPNGTLLLSIVWPDKVNFPDFLNPNTSLFWDIGLNMLYKKIPFQGIWLDMNEVATFADGELGYVNNLTDILNNPPYKPAHYDEAMFGGTARLDAVHYGNVKEYYVHTIFAYLEAKATFNYLKTVSDLVFILTRASFYGSGQYTAHWTGDNMATYEFLSLSIPGIMNFNFYGIPFTGSDICGFTNDTTPELCARWFQLGTLYPFSRDHNEKVAISQEPYALGSTVLETAKVTLAFRYTIVRHYYTLFLKQNGTGTAFRPLFFAYPTDQNLFNASLPYTDNQFLIGDSLMAAPALEKGQTTVTAYFPKDTWFDFITGKLIKSSNQEAGTVEIDAPFNTTAPIFIRGGYIVPTQNVTGVNRTDDLSSNYQLNVAFKSGDNANVHKAKGELVGISNFEDGNVLDKCRHGNCLYTVKSVLTLSASTYDLSISFTAQGDLANYEDVTVSSVLMMGDFEDTKKINEYLRMGAQINSNVQGDVKAEVVANNVVRFVFASPVKVQPGTEIRINSARKLIQI